MFSPTVDKLLSQFFSLSAEERSCLLEVLVDSQPINSSDRVESFLSKRPMSAGQVGLSVRTAAL